MKCDAVKLWLDGVAYSHSGSKLTEQHYRSYFQKFCDFIEKMPEEIVQEYEHSDEKTFKRRYGRYLKTFISTLMGKDYAPNTVNYYVAVVKSFFKYLDLPLSFIPQGRHRVLYHNRDLTKEEIQKILHIARIRDRAFYTMMLQSGLRPHTLCLLKKKHIEPDFSENRIPCKIEVPEKITKGKFGKYFTFMGEESVKYLRDYFKTRPDMNDESYLFVKYGDLNAKVSRGSFTHIFKNHVETLRNKGEIQLERIKGKPAPLRLYNLRKYFKKMATPAGQELVEFWMGHAGGVERHYLSKDAEWHRKQYAEKAMPYLRLETATPSETDKVIQRLEKQLTERDEKIQELEEFRKDTIKKIHEFAEMKRSVKHDLEYIRQMRKDLEFYKEGGVSVAYMKNKISKEDVKKLIKESKKAREE